MKMTSQDEKKMAIAKLYNMKSVVEAMVTMIKSGAMLPAAALSHVSDLSASALLEFESKVKSDGIEDGCCSESE